MATPDTRPSRRTFLKAAGATAAFPALQSVDQIAALLRRQDEYEVIRPEIRINENALVDCPVPRLSQTFSTPDTYIDPDTNTVKIIASVFENGAQGLMLITLSRNEQECRKIVAEGAQDAAWAPDGEHIIFQYGTNLFTVDTTNPDPQIELFQPNAKLPEVNGNTISYVNTDPNLPNPQIVRMDVPDFRAFKDALTSAQERLRAELADHPRVGQVLGDITEGIQESWNWLAERTEGLRDHLPDIDINWPSALSLQSLIPDRLQEFVGQMDTINITGIPNIQFYDIKPSGDFIAITYNGQLHYVPNTGGEVRPINEVFPFNQEAMDEFTQWGEQYPAWGETKFVYVSPVNNNPTQWETIVVDYEHKLMYSLGQFHDPVLITDDNLVVKNSNGELYHIDISNPRNPMTMQRITERVVQQETQTTAPTTTPEDGVLFSN